VSGEYTRGSKRVKLGFEHHLLLQKELPMASKPIHKTFTVSLEHKKARGLGFERRDEILAAAKALFLTEGVESVSTRKLAQLVGLSQTGIYVYFKSKQAILAALIDTSFRKLGAALSEIDGNSKEAIRYLELAIPVYIRWGLENPDEYRLAFMLRDRGTSVHPRSMADPSEKSFEGVKVFGELEKVIVAGFAAGELNSIDKDPRAIAQCVWASLHGLVSLLIVFPIFDWVERDRLIAAHTRLLLDGLKPRAGALPRTVKKSGRIKNGG
jgi:AcrR family transcriptional regulator